MERNSYTVGNLSSTPGVFLKTSFLCPLSLLLSLGPAALAQTSSSPAVPADPPVMPPASSQTVDAVPQVAPQTAPQTAMPGGTGAADASTGPAAAKVVVRNALLDGTAIKLRLSQTITAATAKVGQEVPFEVIEEVDVQGVPVIAKGAQAVATVTEAQGKRSMGRGGKLDVNIDSVRLVDGEKAALRATEGGTGGGHVGAMTAGMVGAAIVFFPAAPLLLFIHGKDITIPEGTIVTAFVEGDMKLELAKFAPVASPVVLPGAGDPASASVQSAMASVMVESSVPGADIEVDGAFMGNTPSTITVTPGKHTIGVKKKGYADWTRDMNVVGTGAKVTANLEAGS